MVRSGVRTYRWQRRKERAMEGDARRATERRDSPLSSYLSTDHHVRLLASLSLSHAGRVVCLLILSTRSLWKSLPPSSSLITISKMAGDIVVVLSSLRRWWSAFACFLPALLLSRDSSPSLKCQATWLWYFPHCAVSPKRPDSMLACWHEKESV